MNFNIPHLNLSWSLDKVKNINIESIIKSKNSDSYKNGLNLEINENCFDYVSLKILKKL